MSTTDKGIDYYVSSLPARQVSHGGGPPKYISFEQSPSYPDKANPIREVERIHLAFSKGGDDNAATATATTTVFKKTSVNTYSLWSIVAGLLDSSHLMSNPSMKRYNVQFVTQSLKDYLSDKTIHKFLTGRRIYPLMELLDKPRVDFDKKHHIAFGYFLSFLLDSTISIMDTEYRWSPECVRITDVNFVNNKDGFWRLSENP